MTTRIALAAVWLAVASAAAQADPASDDKATKQTAKSYVDAALQAQNTGDYATALILYQKAYDLVPHPVLLFDMAQAHRLAGRPNKALKLYRKYLAVDPRGSEARTARELIAELEAKQHAGARPSEPSDEPEPASRAAEPAAPEPAAPEPAAPAAPERDAGADRPTPPAAVRAPHLRLAIGSSVARRELAFDVRPGLGDIPPSPTTTGGALRLEAEAYLSALTDDDGPLADLGVALAYDKTFGVKLNMVGQSDDMALGVDQSHLAIGARYRFVSAAGAALTAGLDYTRRQYVLDRAPMVVFDVPDVDYAAITPRVDARLQLSPGVAVLGSLDVLLVFDTGGIARRDSYGKSSVFGFDTAAGLEVALSERIRLRVLLEYSRIASTFDGNGTLASGRDGDITTQDVAGATDSALGGVATLGLTY